MAPPRSDREITMPTWSTREKPTYSNVWSLYTKKMIAEHIPQPSLLQGTLLVLVVSVVTRIVCLEIKHRALSDIPGPWVARYTNAWRCYLAWVYSDRPGGITYHEVIHKKYGDVVRVGPKTVFINDPAGIPVVLGFKDRLEKTDSVNAFMQPGKPTSIVGIRNEQKHASYRRPIQGAYSLSSLKLYEPAIDDMINKLTSIFDEKCRSKTVINVTQWCHFFSYDTIMNITFGAPLGFLDNAKDMYGLIANQVKHVAYVRVHPGEQDRLYEEIVKNTREFPVSLEDTVNMPYLGGVIREGYRLHHGGDIAIERKVGPSGATLPDGRFIPAYYDIAMSSPSIRVCSAFGEEPHVFKPERWMRAKGESDDDWKARRTYMDKADLTFSQGSRACIGKSFTHLELFKVVASVMGQFKLELAGTPKRFVVPVQLVRRSDSVNYSGSNDVYPGDRTVAAASRLRAQHNVSKAALGGLVFAPLNFNQPNVRVLDCGTADGYWLYDLSKQLDPSAALIGTDIGSFPLDSFPKPRNMTLSIHSYKDPWPASWQNSFDLVHMRFCVAGLKDPNEARIAIDRLICLVKPGGWIQLVDSTLSSGRILDNDKPSTILFKSMARMLESKGQDTGAGLRIRPLLEGSDRLSHIDSKEVVAKLGKGAESEQLRKDGVYNLMKMIDTLKPKLEGLVDWPVTPAKLEELRSQIVEEANSTGADKAYYAAWGKRIT
uniref:Tryprostatin B 6-hydroxylase n=1 Tax=Talaromyces marneffei PM1 TaxID=1077442 RepID=A0A093UQ86_TALMA